MKRFNSVFFIICSILLAAFAYETYIQAVAIDEGRIGNSRFRHLLADMFNIMRFPILMLFKGWSSSALNFSLGLIGNCLLYSLALERILYLITRPKNVDDFDS